MSQKDGFVGNSSIVNRSTVSINRDDDDSFDFRKRLEFRNYDNITTEGDDESLHYLRESNVYAVSSMGDRVHDTDFNLRATDRSLVTPVYAAGKGR